MTIANSETLSQAKPLETLIQELSPDLRGEVRDFVEFILTKRHPPQPTRTDFPLKGTVLRYESPFAPVAESTWEAAQ